MAYDLNFTIQNGSETASIKIDKEAVEKLYPNATPGSIVASAQNHLSDYIRERVGSVAAVALIQEFLDAYVSEVD